MTTTVPPTVFVIGTIILLILLLIVFVVFTIVNLFSVSKELSGPSGKAHRRNVIMAIFSLTVFSLALCLQVGQILFTPQLNIFGNIPF